MTALTAAEIGALVAGDETNVLVAEALGGEWRVFSGSYSALYVEDVVVATREASGRLMGYFGADYNDIAAAMSLLPIMQARGWLWSIHWDLVVMHNLESFGLETMLYDNFDALPLAICKCVLLALNGKKEG